MSSPLGGRPTVVAIVAPGGYAPDPLGVARADALLLAQGCDVRHFDAPDGRYLRFAETDAARLAGLHAAARDPEVDIVLPLRGGYGTSRLLQAIDFHLLAASGKLFVGHSDVTVLNMGLLAHGASSFAGPTTSGDFASADVSAFTMAQFWSCMRGPEHTISFAADGNPAIEAEGMLWGGNLAMIAHLAGTPWMPMIDGGILFVEDINEQPFRIERMLLQLLHAGVLERQAALVLGDFSGGRTTDYDNGYGFAAMLDFIRSRIAVPVLTGLPYGHIPDKATLAIGSSASLVSSAAGVSLTMRGYPHLSNRGMPPAL
ncbi:MAG: muramoyltetrapeptide carboxypeptidase [Herminiimonas sp.]|nr:muramoyltetrapeptide carboxypeptidase [Herminiimonas sp.]